jgi:hypothetical protein
MNTTKVSSTVPLKQATTYGNIKLKVKTCELEVSREDGDHSIVSIDIPMKDIGMDRIAGNVLEELEMRGVARSVSEAAVEAMIESLNDGLLMEALKSLVVSNAIDDGKI